MKEKKLDKKRIAKEGTKFFNEFKEFIAQGNVIDLAVGVVIGSAFGKIVTSIVNDIIMPLIGVLIGGIDFTSLSVKVGDANISYGNFIQNVVDFLIVAACIFVVIKIIERFAKKNKEEEKKEESVKETEEVLLLREIRDLLKKENK